MPGTLYVVSTPIGNLDDITQRALEILKSVGLIAAEDTRRTSNLLSRFCISTPTTSLHKHNETQKNRFLLQKLADGVDIALVSDAGTPLVADPGQRLIAAAAQEGVRVVPIPGASAILAALAVSGFPADQFVFAGFAPARSNDRKSWYEQLASERRTVVYFEAPHRIAATLADVSLYLGERQIVVARELTKRFETILRTTANRAKDLKMPARGEFTVVLGPILSILPHEPIVDETEILDVFYQMTNDMGSRRAAIAETARRFGLSSKDVYARIERAKASGSSS